MFLRRLLFLIGVVGVVISAVSVHAQQRPLVTEDPESIGSGLVLVEGGFDYVRNQPYSVSGLKGHRFRTPTLGLSIGVSSIAEIQIDGISYQRLSVTKRMEAPLSSRLRFSGDTTVDMDGHCHWGQGSGCVRGQSSTGYCTALCDASAECRKRERSWS